MEGMILSISANNLTASSKPRVTNLEYLKGIKLKIVVASL